MAIVRQDAAVENLLGVATVLRLHVEVRFADREGFGVHLLPEQVDVGGLIDRAAREPPLGAVGALLIFLADPGRDVLLGDGEHAPRPAAGVVDGQRLVGDTDLPFVTREQEVDHQVNDIAGREVLAGVLVQGFVELAYQLFEDRAHRGVVDGIGVQVDRGIVEPLHHLEEQPRFIELADGVVEVELLNHLSHVGAEAGDVPPQVRGQVLVVGEQTVEVETRDVVEGEAGGLAEQAVSVLELALVLGLGLQDCRLRLREHTVQPPQHRERQDHV